MNMKKDELTENLYDEIYKYAAAQRMDELAGEYPSDDELGDIKLSPQFKKKMGRYFKRLRRQNNRSRNRKIALRIAAGIIVLLLVSTTVVFSVEAFRLPVLNLLRNIGKESTTIYVKEGDADYSSVADKIHGLYLPSYIPDSYSIKVIINSANNKRVTYEDTANRSINFMYLLYNTTLGIDSENAQEKQVPVNGEDAQLYIKGDYGTLIFSFKDQQFVLQGHLSEQEIIKMAESLKLHE
jgi:hypothetical protein